MNHILGFILFIKLKRKLNKLLCISDPKYGKVKLKAMITELLWTAMPDILGSK